MKFVVVYFVGLLFAAATISTVASKWPATRTLGSNQNVQRGPFRFVSAVANGAQADVDTDTKGTVKLRFDEGFTQLNFHLEIEDGMLITQAHLHCGFAGVNGPPAVFLFNVAPVPGPGGEDVDGTANEGTLMNGDIVEVTCPSGYVITNLVSLYHAIRIGEIYLNVHSETYPNGVIRGQLFI